jgi:hypothetical protein
LDGIPVASLCAGGSSTLPAGVTLLGFGCRRIFQLHYQHFGNPRDIVLLDREVPGGWMKPVKFSVIDSDWQNVFVPLFRQCPSLRTSSFVNGPHTISVLA